MRIRSVYCFVAGLAALVAGCNSESVIAVRGADETLRTVPVGADVRITLQNVGPGEYTAPPQVSSAALRYESVSIVPPYVPAGPTQEFRFKAVSPGQAVVVFTHTGYNRTITDTVTVR
jgi:hypothetical protein